MTEPGALEAAVVKWKQQSAMRKNEQTENAKIVTFRRKDKMERRHTHRYMDLGTLVTYVLMAMAFSIAVIVSAALIMQADILAWNPTTLITIFFVLTGGICGAFILLK